MESAGIQNSGCLSSCWKQVCPKLCGNKQKRISIFQVSLATCSPERHLDSTFSIFSESGYIPWYEAIHHNRLASQICLKSFGYISISQAKIFWTLHLSASAGMGCGAFQGENDKGEVTDVCSFYSLPSSILGAHDFKRVSEGHSGIAGDLKDWLFMEEDDSAHDMRFRKVLGPSILENLFSMSKLKDHVPGGLWLFWVVLGGFCGRLCAWSGEVMPNTICWRRPIPIGMWRPPSHCRCDCEHLVKGPTKDELVDIWGF